MISLRHRWLWHARVLLVWAMLAAPAYIPRAWGQQQQRGVCARVKIVILQELALERVGFEATLEITNNDGDDPITDFFAALTFENPQLTTNAVNDASSLFLKWRASRAIWISRACFFTDCTAAASRSGPPATSASHGDGRAWTHSMSISRITISWRGRFPGQEVSASIRG